MLKPLTLEQRVWVDNTLAAMTPEECIGQMLMPDCGAHAAAEWAAVLRDVPVGSVFAGAAERTGMQAVMDAIQSHSRVPVAVAADWETGRPGATEFPHAMAFGAAGDPALARAAARVTAREARAAGVHWIFQPAAELLYCFRNPELDARTFGDKPARVRALVAAQVRGLQEEGFVAATLGRFPGAGADERDSRLFTTLNPFELPKWRRTFGSVWRGGVHAGAMAAQAGNIALPDREALLDRPHEALPAELSHPVLTGLLRDDMGFDGVVVSSPGPAAGMIPADERALRFVLAGGDVYRCGDARHEFERLVRAMRDGRFWEDRVRASARRVLELKARVGLYRGLRAAPVTAAEVAAHAAVAAETAERGITLWRSDGQVPARLTAGARVLTITLDCARQDESPAAPALAVVDEELRRRGCDVEHLHNPSAALLLERARNAGLVCINVVRPPGAAAEGDGTRGNEPTSWWRGIRIAGRPVVFTVFGSPFAIYEAPSWANVVLTYGTCAACQRAAVKVWLGEAEPRGVLPVRLPRF